MKKRELNRRQFLKYAAITAVGVAGFPYFVPSSALGKAGNVAASNRITMGCIGVGGKRPGGQGTADMQGFLGRDDVKVVAVCDVDRVHRNRARVRIHHPTTPLQTPTPRQLSSPRSAFYCVPRTGGCGLIAITL